MALYDYECENCEHRFERHKEVEKRDETPPCPECGGPAKRDQFPARTSIHTADMWAS